MSRVLRWGVAVALGCWVFAEYVCTTDSGIDA